MATRRFHAGVDFLLASSTGSRVTEEAFDDALLEYEQEMQDEEEEQDERDGTEAQGDM